MVLVISYFLFDVRAGAERTPGRPPQPQHGDFRPLDRARRLHAGPRPDDPPERQQGQSRAMLTSVVLHGLRFLAGGMTKNVLHLFLATMFLRTLLIWPKVPSPTSPPPVLIGQR